MRSLLPPEERIVSREAAKGALFGLGASAAGSMTLSSLNPDFKAISPRFKLGMIAASGVTCGYLAADSASRTLPLSPDSPIHLSPDPIYPGSLDSPDAHQTAKEQQTFFGHARTDGSIHSELEAIDVGYSNEDVKEAAIAAALGSAFGLTSTYALNQYSPQFRLMQPMWKLGSIGVMSMLVTFAAINRYHQQRLGTKPNSTGTVASDRK